MKSLFSAVCAGLAFTFVASCSPKGEVKSYNEGINIIPMPQSLTQGQGKFMLSGKVAIGAQTPELKTVAEYFASKMSRSTGYNIKVSDSGAITLMIDPSLDVNDEGYLLDVTPESVTVKAKTAQGVFYGMQSFMQLLPAEIESMQKVRGIEWSAQAVNIKDEPRFGYRGLMIDVCRHFMEVEDIKKQLDIMALFKINRLHWHLTDDQGWRIEIKKHPKLTEVGSVRMEAEGYEHKGYYTQEQVKDIVKYAAERFITVVPEIELPGHEMAAIAAYPELSCKGEPGTPRIIWGVEDVVMCAGKEEPFKLLEDVIREVAPLFPGEYFHIGGDECPKKSWKECPLCQKRIKDEGLKADSKHTAEEKLQSYFVQRMEKVVESCGKKMIGWDEILEGGLAPSATVMSWRGEEGGIEAALMNHDVIMTPAGNGLYLDLYQGDSKIEPVAIYGYIPLSKTYSYNPVPDTLVAMNKAHYVIGVQANVWSEYFYSEDIREYRTYPRALALSEIAWTNVENKNYEDFERRINNAYVRLDAYDINYHIPQPEQPYGSCNFVAFTDTARLTFQTSRPEKMVYTLDGTDPVPASAKYTEPLVFTENATLKIRTVLPSGKMSPVRTITVEKQTLAPACNVKKTAAGLEMEVTYGDYRNMTEFEAAKAQPAVKTVIKDTKELVVYEKPNDRMKNVKQYGAVATGYINIPADGVYYFSTEFEQLSIDGKVLIDNADEVKKFCRRDKSVALAKGLHEIKLVFLGHIIKGFPSNWGEGTLRMRAADSKEFIIVGPEMLSH